MAITLSGSLILSGSIEATGGVTISGSIASASYAANAGTASYVVNSLTASYVVNSLTASYVVNSLTASFVANAVSSSYSLNALTSSNAMTASSADTLYVRNNVTALGSITAQTLVVQTITSSVDFVTGSTRFGSLLTNTHLFTGSLSITGSLSVITTGTEFQVNASGTNIGNALTDNHIISGSVTINPNGLFVSSSGNVGIGSASPGFRLETLGTSVIVAGFGRSDYGASNVMLIGMSGYRDVYKSAIGVVRTGDYDVGNMIFCLNAAANSTVVSASDERMRITSAGNVGIGTSSPGYKLEVSGTGYFSSTLTSGGTISGNNISTGGTLTGAYLSVGSAVYTYNVTTFYYRQNFAFTVPNALNSGSDNSAMRMYMVWVWGANGVTEAGCKVWMVAMNGGGTAYTANEILGRDANGGTGLSIARTSASQLTISSNNNAFIKFVSIMQLMTYSNG